MLQVGHCGSCVSHHPQVKCNIVATDWVNYAVSEKEDGCHNLDKDNGRDGYWWAMGDGQITGVTSVTDEQTDGKWKIEQNAGRAETSTLMYPSLCWNNATGWYRVATPYTRQCFLWAAATVLFDFCQISLQKVRGTHIAEAEEKNWCPKFI